MTQLENRTGLSDNQTPEKPGKSGGRGVWDKLETDAEIEAFCRELVAQAMAGDLEAMEVCFAIAYGEIGVS